MIFSPPLLAKVLDGTKTQTRRLRLDSQDAAVFDYGLVGTGEPRVITAVVRHTRTARGGFERVRWRLGATYAVVPGRTQKAVGRIKVTGIRAERLSQISDTDIAAEGFPSRADFHEAFLRLNRLPGGEDPPVWVLHFRLAGAPEPRAESRWLRFEWASLRGLRTQTCDVVSRRSGGVLGEIKWYARWRQYAFFPSRATIFNRECLGDIATEIGAAMSARRAK